MREVGKLVLIFIAFLVSLALACLAQTGGNSRLVSTESETSFLDRLMRAELGGRQFAKNPASSALGPFQFLETTFLDIVRRNFPELTAGKTDAEVLALRTDPKVARDVALVYTRENASALAAKGVIVTAGHLRLAFFAGAAGALKVIEAHPDELVSNLLSAAAIQANPFLKTMTASQLLARAEREASGVLAVAAGLPQPTSVPSGIAVQCNLKLASCRHWLALAKNRLLKEPPRSVSTADRR